jgi:hypothetical protein
MSRRAHIGEFAAVRVATRHLERRVSTAVSAAGVSERFITAKTFNLNIGDPVLYGKYKNKAGVIVGFDKDDKGNPLVLVDPVPKGRKQTKAIQLFRIWHGGGQEDVV